MLHSQEQLILRPLEGHENRAGSSLRQARGAKVLKSGIVQSSSDLQK